MNKKVIYAPPLFDILPILRGKNLQKSNFVKLSK